MSCPPIQVGRVSRVASFDSTLSESMPSLDFQQHCL